MSWTESDEIFKIKKIMPEINKKGTITKQPVNVEFAFIL